MRLLCRFLLNELPLASESDVSSVLRPWLGKWQTNVANALINLSQWQDAAKSNPQT